MCTPAALLAIVLIRAEYFYVRHVSHKFVAVNMEYIEKMSLCKRAAPSLACARGERAFI
jgi:hypothetical protein